MSVVFTDVFTVASDTNLNAYPSGSPDYADMDGPANALYANAANDRVQSATTLDDLATVCIDTAWPNTDYEVTYLAYRTATNYEAGMLAVRGTTGSGGNYYEFTFATASAIELYRVDNGSFSLLQTFTRSPGTGVELTCVNKVTGTNPVALEFTAGATAVCTYNDSNASRKQTGRGGPAIYQTSANAVYVDTISVDDLSAGGLPIPIAMYHYLHNLGSKL